MSNLEALRKRGNFAPKEAFEEKKAPEEKKEVTKQVDEKQSNAVEEIATDKYVPSPNQRKTLKVSPQTKRELEELKRYLRVEFNYEAIQFLIDDYVNTRLTASEKTRFKGNTI
ncbi:hypothetical protein LNP00_06445 [Fructobacillus sp. M158]|uniref:hypothetical protein n=1 Tax=Fructobacillus parabroussonetiae TaxID=2713174 RepID=UPI00200B861E|nr:hypothetical protein [Fructobacillus parabroussonetiae]MCK8617990.1 hypothetical protein [Fructobacillus parabroussonetiae]